MIKVIRISLLMISGFYSGTTIGQNKFNSSLKKELDSIYDKHNMFISLRKRSDKKEIDSLMVAYNSKNTDALVRQLRSLQEKYDSSNINRVKAIVQHYGYPGKSLVGEPTDEVAFLVLQRELNKDEITFERYFSIFQKAAETEELPFRLYAWVLDWSLMKKGKEQIYGTIISSIPVPTSSYLVGMKRLVWPIQDPERVNERRKAIGINTTVEEMAKEQFIEYKVYTLDDVKKLQGK